MDRFTDALINKYTLRIPREFDWFPPLIGDWDITYNDEHNGTRRVSNGEWLFRRVLNGSGIEDLFICPSGSHVSPAKQAADEYGLAVRIFNAKEGCYDTAYAHEGFMKRLRFVKEGDKLVGTLLDNTTRKWIFSEMQENSFKWNNITLREDGAWHINSSVYATRKLK